MKKVVKFFIIAFAVVGLFSMGQGKIVSASNVTPGDGIARTIQFGGQNLYLDFGNQKNAIAYAKDGSSTQEFYFEYHSDKKAYKIYSAHNPNLILAWNAYRYTDLPQNVFYTNNGDLDEHYWVLERDLMTNKYYLRNYAQGAHGYLTAKWGQGGMNVLIGSKVNYTNNYTEISISPSLEADTAIESGKWSIVSAAYTVRALHINWTDYNVSVFYRKPGLNQCWSFEYYPDKGAYKIRNKGENNQETVLTWNSDVNDNVFGKKDTDSDDQYWKLEAIGNGNYIIKNYKNENKVLDLKKITLMLIDVKVSDRTNSTTQQFKLEKY